MKIPLFEDVAASFFFPMTSDCCPMTSSSPRSFATFAALAVNLSERIGAAGPHRPTGIKEVGKMPTLLEDTGGPPVPLFEEVESLFQHLRDSAFWRLFPSR
jgi:hypothetical protein